MSRHCHRSISSHSTLDQHIIEQSYGIPTKNGEATHNASHWPSTAESFSLQSLDKN